MKGKTVKNGEQSDAERRAQLREVREGVHFGAGQAYKLREVQAGDGGGVEDADERGAEMSNAHVHSVFSPLLRAIMPVQSGNETVYLTKRGREELQRRMGGKPVLCLECRRNPAEIDGRCRTCEACVAGARA